MKQSVIQSIMKRVSIAISIAEENIYVYKDYAQYNYDSGKYQHATKYRKDKEHWEKKRNKLVFIQKELKAELKAQKKPKVSKKHAKL